MFKKIFAALTLIVLAGCGDATHDSVGTATELLGKGSASATAMPPTVAVPAPQQTVDAQAHQMAVVPHIAEPRVDDVVVAPNARQPSLRIGSETATNGKASHEEAFDTIRRNSKTMGNLDTYFQ